MTWVCAAVVCLLLLSAAHGEGWGGSPASYYYDHWCGGELKYLDDRTCSKAFPSSLDRDQRCSVQYDDGGSELGYAPDSTHFSNVTVWKSEAMQRIPGIDNVNVALIMVRRVKEANGTQSATYKYIGNGKEGEPVETWSSSKVFAVANAASSLHTRCAQNLSLSSSTMGMNGDTYLPDLATIICSYDTTMGYTSNSLAKYFSTAGGQGKLDYLVQDWLGLAGQGQSLGGSYGEAPPGDLGYSFYSDDPDDHCTLTTHPEEPYAANTLSTLTMAELVRRMALYREIDPANRFPNTTWDDMQDILYGAQQSVFFGGEQWGGMSVDTAIFLQSGLNMTQVDLDSNGAWRIFSKLGAGYSSSRNVGEIVTNGYVCAPRLAGGSEHTSPSGGVEFALSARSSVPHDTTLVGAQAILEEVVRNVVAMVYNGTIV